MKDEFFLDTNVKEKEMGNTTVKLERAEEEALSQMVKVGLFSSKDEAVRTAIAKYASDLGIPSTKMLWKKISKHKKRKVTPAQLKKDLEELENDFEEYITPKSFIKETGLEPASSIF